MMVHGQDGRGRQRRAGVLSCAGVGSDPRFAPLTDAELKARVDALVRAAARCTPAERWTLFEEAAALREELIDRLHGGGGEEGAGAREPRRPRPSGGAAAVAPEDEPGRERGAEGVGAVAGPPTG